MCCQIINIWAARCHEGFLPYIWWQENSRPDHKCAYVHGIWCLFIHTVCVHAHIEMMNCLMFSFTFSSTEGKREGGWCQIRKGNSKIFTSSGINLPCYFTVEYQNVKRNASVSSQRQKQALPWGLQRSKNTLCYFWHNEKMNMGKNCARTHYFLIFLVSLLFKYNCATIISHEVNK